MANELLLLERQTINVIACLLKRRVVGCHN
jgi:hypothetical protein